MKWTEWAERRLGPVFTLTVAVSICGQVCCGPRAVADDFRQPAQFDVYDQQARPIAATPIAATPIAATPIAATPIAATPIAATPITAEQGMAANRESQSGSAAHDAGHSSQSSSRRQTTRPFTARWGDVTERQVVHPSENWRLRWRESDPANRRQVTSDRAATTAYRQPTTSTTAAITETPPRVHVDANVKPIRFNEPRRLDHGSTVPVAQASSSVRFASQQVPDDPFSDPFGDRNLPLPAERASDEPTLIEPPLTAPPAGRGDFVPPTDPAPPLESPFESEGRDAAPMPMPPTESTPFSYDPAPAPPASADPKCDRVYNRRDCCEGGKECEEHRQRVRQSPLSAISLDITPQMTVTQLDRTNYDAERQNTMRRVPARVWKDDDGAILADGRLTNYRNNHVEIETEDGLKKVPFADLSDDDMCFLAAWWSIPGECSLGNAPVIERDFVASTLAWKASSICHKPLYFEDVNLERYGHTAGPIVQPVLSGAHFFANVVALPYKMGINPPTECRYPLGFYRPGDCAPWLVRPIPLSIRGGLTAAAAYVGGAYILQ